MAGPPVLAPLLVAGPPVLAPLALYLLNGQSQVFLGAFGLLVVLLFRQKEPLQGSHRVARRRTSSKAIRRPCFEGRGWRRCLVNGPVTLLCLDRWTPAGLQSVGSHTLRRILHRHFSGRTSASAHLHQARGPALLAEPSFLPLSPPSYAWRDER